VFSAAAKSKGQRRRQHVVMGSRPITRRRPAVTDRKETLWRTAATRCRPNMMNCSPGCGRATSLITEFPAPHVLGIIGRMASFTAKSLGNKR
jgi:hypothetical protein